MKNFEFLILNLSRYRFRLTFVIFSFILSCLYIFPQVVLADTPTPSPVASVTPTQTESTTPTTTQIPMRKYPLKVTVIPNPASGTKLSFRVMAPAPCKVRIRVNNRFFDVVAKFEKEGGTLFDILWNLKDVPEGIYYFQAQVEDKATGQITQLPLQKFVVLKPAD